VRKEPQLWQFIADRLKLGQRVMLLVVATSSGSSPGRPGYKMAVAEDGELVGSIGGGVMEVNLVEHSRQTLARSSQGDDRLTSSIVEKVHRKNVPNSSGMICSGKQTIIFKLLEPKNLDAVTAAMTGIETRDGSYVQITPEAIHIEPANAGSQNFDIEFDRRSDSEFEYHERLGAKNELYIVGGGHCALALSEMMSKMDFFIHLYDDRPQLNTILQNEFADTITVMDSYERIAEYIDSDSRGYLVVMTLGYKTDATVIRNLIDKDFKYFGVLGSEAKMAALFRELTAEGFSRDRLNTIRTPIGLRINSHSPEEIAVSIAAEIIAIKNAATL
jgi:xanthine dehydrogenase accessory factor